MDSDCEEDENVAEEERILVIEVDEENANQQESGEENISQESDDELIYDESVKIEHPSDTELTDNEVPPPSDSDINGSIVSEDDFDDPTRSNVFSVILLDDEDNKNILVIDDDEISDDKSSHYDELSDDEDVPDLSTHRVIVEEGFLVCSKEEVEPIAFDCKAVVEEFHLCGSGWNTEANICVQVNKAVYPPLERLPDRTGAFIFNGHKYYTVKGGRKGITYYTCWRARKRGTCPVRCKVRSDGTVEISGEHDHPPISSAEETRTEFKRSLREACISTEKDVSLRQIYDAVAAVLPEGAKLYSFAYARRLMMTCRNTVHEISVVPQPRPPQKYYPPDPERQFVPGRGLFLEGYRYYKMKSGQIATYFKCSESKRGCRAACRVKIDGSAIVSGVHIHEPADHESVFVIDNFKIELKNTLSNPDNKGKNIREIYRIAAEKDPAGAAVYPFDVAKHFLFKRRGRVSTPRRPELLHPRIEVPPYGKRFIHLNYKYHLVKKRTGRAMYFKCGQWKSGCQVNLRVLLDGTVITAGKHNHEPAPEIEIERRRLMEKLRFAVLAAGPLETLRQIYDAVMAEEGEEKAAIYPWKHAWYFMERLRKKKVQEQELASVKHEVPEREYSEVVEEDEQDFQEVGYYRLIDEDGNPCLKQEMEVDEEEGDLPNGEVSFEYYIDDEEGISEVVEEELDPATAELLRNAAVIVKVPKANEKLSQKKLEQEVKGTVKPPRKSRAKRKSISIDPSVKRVVIVPVYPQNMEENYPEEIEEDAEEMYQEVIVNEDGSMEPAIIFVGEDVGEVAADEVTITD